MTDHDPIDHTKDAGCQFMFSQQMTKIENGGFVGNPLQTKPDKLAQDGVSYNVPHRWIAVAEPVLHQVYTQHRQQ